MERLRLAQSYHMEPRPPKAFKAGAGGFGDDLRTTRPRLQATPASGSRPAPVTRPPQASHTLLRGSTSSTLNTLVMEEEVGDSSEDPINCISLPESSPPHISPPRRASALKPGPARSARPPSSPARNASRRMQNTVTSKQTSVSRQALDKNDSSLSPSSSSSSSPPTAAREFPMKLSPKKKPSTRTFPMKLPDKSEHTEPLRSGPRALPMELRKLQTKGTSGRRGTALVMEGSSGDDDSTLPDVATASIPPKKPNMAAFPMALEKGKKKLAVIPSSRSQKYPTILGATSSDKAIESNDGSKSAAKPFPMPLSPQKARPIEERGKKRESPKGKARELAAERALKKSRLQNGKAKPTFDEDDDEELPTGTMESMRLSSSQSSSSGAEDQPRELCPFCDEPWPEQPSKRLLALLKQVKARAWKEPRFTNPNGLNAPMEAFVTLCTLHRSESSHIPEGIAEGWPTRIDFSAIPGRLMRLKNRLDKLISNPSTSPFFQAAKNDILQKGARVAASALGQYETFERCQPGYYGERGMVVIERALTNMFPDIELSDCEPLSIDDFIRQTMIPEAALLLIREDTGLDRAAGLAVLVKSRKYGIAKFPERDGGDTQWNDTSFTPDGQRVPPPRLPDSPLESPSLLRSIKGNVVKNKPRLRETKAASSSVARKNGPKLVDSAEPDVISLDTDMWVDVAEDQPARENTEGDWLWSSDNESPSSSEVQEMGDGRESPDL